jgi:hypothetical protein
MSIRRKDLAGRHEPNEQFKLHKLLKVNANRLTLVLSTPSLKDVGSAPGLRSAP